jgi:hypothetical protein
MARRKVDNPSGTWSCNGPHAEQYASIMSRAMAPLIGPGRWMGSKPANAVRALSRDLLSICPLSVSQ